jgi:hypothetical protein
MLVGVHACQWCVRCAGGCEQRRTFHRQSQGAQVGHRGRILLQLQLKLQQQSRDGILHLEHRKVLPEANARTSLCCVGMCGIWYGVVSTQGKIIRRAYGGNGYAVATVTQCGGLEVFVACLEGGELVRRGLGVVNEALRVEVEGVLPQVLTSPHAPRGKHTEKPCRSYITNISDQLYYQ